MARLILLLFFGIIPFSGIAQFFEQKIWPITNELGQSPGATFSILEDNRGFIWFGTLGGLVRYDGYGFREFKYSEEDESSLSNNMIRAMHLGSDGMIWIGTQGGGLNRFDPVLETFTRYKHEPGNASSLPGNEIWSLAEDHEGNLWVGTWGGGLARLQKDTGVFTSYDLWPGNPLWREDGIRSLLVRNNQLWVGMHSTGLFRRCLETGQTTHFSHQPNVSGSIASNAVYSIFADRDGHLWIATFVGGLQFFDERSDRFVVFNHDPQNPNSPASNNTYHIMQSFTGELWISHDRMGITIFDYQNHSFRRLRQDKCMGNSISSDRVRFIFQDSNGVIWIANENGVDKIVENKKFSLFRYLPDQDNSLNTRVVRTIYEDHNGLLWIGAYDVFTLAWDRHSQRFVRNNKLISTIGLKGITSMMQDAKHQYWVGTSEGVFVFDSRQNLVRKFLYDPGNLNSISDNTIQVIRQGPDNRIWIGTENGLNVFDPRTEQWKVFRYNREDAGSLSNNKIQPNALIMEENGEAWVGTWGGGLNRYIPAEDRFVRFVHDENTPGSLNNNNVISLYKNGDVLWVGTFGGGLNRLDITTGTFQAFTEIHGLPNNIVYAILPDKEGYLWLSTDNGLSRFHPQTKEFLNFDTSDGLPVNQFFWGASFLSPSGEMYFGTTDGLVSFLPENISLNTRVPTVTLTDVKIFNESLRFDRSVAYIDRLDFRYDVLSFQIEFTTLDYAVPQKNQFAYKIEGRDENWVFIGNRNFINFTNMAPGKYRLTIIGSNNDGLWSTEGRTILIHIHPPYWQTLWFRVLMGVVVLVGFVVFYKWRTQRVKQQKKELEQEVRQRTLELASANEELLNINEELHSQREELATANEELYSQREELEATLNKLQSTQSQLVHSEKMASLGVLAAGVAHEINNPLNFIHGGVMAIDDYFEDHHRDIKPEIAPLLDIIYAGVKRASGIVASLNHYSRKDDTVMGNYDMHELMESCLRMLDGHLKDRITVVREYTSDNALIRCNEGKIHQAMLNILTNAMHAIEDKGEIRIATSMEKDKFCIVVSDNGCGIDPAHLSRITDPFFTTKEPGKGTGLGLSITLNIIEEHNGQLLFASQLHKGTQVRVVLPQ